ncbi:MAG: hypothetical protein AAFP18_07685 [Bacteroidota bacterium]
MPRFCWIVLVLFIAAGCDSEESGPLGIQDTRNFEGSSSDFSYVVNGEQQRGWTDGRATLSITRFDDGVQHEFTIYFAPSIVDTLGTFTVTLDSFYEEGTYDGSVGLDGRYRSETTEEGVEQILSAVYAIADRPLYASGAQGDEDVFVIERMDGEFAEGRFNFQDEERAMVSGRFKARIQGIFG